ncbi:MAG: M1 family metallopeptidase [Pyrinomonadaceae bacterium]
MKITQLFTALFVFIFLGANLSCKTGDMPNNKSETNTPENSGSLAKDHHSYANPEAVRVTNVDLDWDVLFDEKMIKGTAVLSFERGKDSGKAPLILDTRDLKIEKTETSNDGGKTYKGTEFKLGEADKFLGSSLTVEMPEDADRVRVSYSTSPKASGLQWLTPEQTAGKKTPFMFSQAQAIHARSFIPLQDSPQIRVTYSAKVRTPKGLLAVMSAEGNSQDKAREGEYEFKMPHPIPSYLIAIAVGDLEFRPLGKRTGVYSEPSVVEKAASELSDTEKMVEETEKVYGEYAWGRYDLLVLPPSFPFGGMENPMLTFATPTILAGDKSLVSLVAHELAHSWSGNLVTNATWRDFWLNEGFTTYLTYRIQEAVYGRPRSEMEATLGRKGLVDELAELKEPDQILHVDLQGRDPDDGFTGVPYEKGALFLRYLEEKFGRDKFDKFVKGYFAKYRFQSITTETFTAYLKENLIDKNPGVVTSEEIDEWINKPGLPKTAPQPKSDALGKVDEQAKSWLEGKTAAKELDTKNWTTQEWLHFLGALPKDLTAEKMSELDEAFSFTKAGNSEIAFAWLILSIKHKYAPADARLEEFLTTVGRRKFVKPLFDELAKTPEGKERAKEIYKKARSGYHPITQTSVDEILEWKEEDK